MPKEYAHWTLAEKAFLAIENPELKSLITENKGLFELGAVAPDMPFYTFLGKRGREFLSAGWSFHGHYGKNTLTFLSDLNRFYDLQNVGQGNRPIWAFILGVITHIIADSQFHPFVYYFSGSRLHPDQNVSQKSTSRHRMIETYLDLHYMQTFLLSHSGKLTALLENIYFERKELVTLLSCLFFSRPDYPPQKIKQSIWRHKAIQSRFFSSQYIIILSALNKLPLIDLDDIITLFYPRQRDVKIPFFHKNFRYCHPVTGEMFEESILDLENRVIKMCQGIYLDLEGWRTGKSVDFRIDSLQGPSAYTGLPSSRTETMTHFDIQDVKKLLFSDA